jgi:hypothetical protein
MKRQTDNAPAFGKSFGKEPSWFARVPTAAVRDTSLTPAEFRVLAAICAYANNQGFAWPNQSTIIEDIGTSQNTIDRALKKLKKKKYLTVVSRHRSHPKWRHVMGNVYRIMFDHGLETDKLIDAMNHNDTLEDTGTIKAEHIDTSNLDIKPGEVRKVEEEESKHTVEVSTDQLVAATSVAQWYSTAAEQSHGIRRLVETRHVDAVIQLMADGWSVAELKLEAMKALKVTREQRTDAPHHLAHAIRSVR